MSRAIVKRLQVMLQAVEPTLRADGWWGSYTQGVYAKAPPSVKAKVDRAAAESGTSVDALKMAHLRSKSKGKHLFKGQAVSEDRAFALIDRAIAQVGESHFGKMDAASHFRRKLEIEAAKHKDGSITYYDAGGVSPNGKYFGLFQMGSAAWKDASTVAPIGDFESGKFDPWRNTLAAVAYAVALIKQLRAKRFRGEITSNVLYTAHNQGAGGFMSYLRGGDLVGKQSEAAIKIAQAARGEAQQVLT